MERTERTNEDENIQSNRRAFRYAGRESFQNMKISRTESNNEIPK